ncbi:hypothetical protein [Mycoplasmopsis gallinarum]|uniref:hypothetical protein n=1 Tax=Mycoplasmopsis gallinarum TaxID=29557 RepID=UPI000566CA1D|nr:hypothetical protein [Mycoplasmopsis gallinarum]
MVIWALYDDASRCYYEALKDKHKVIGIGINSHQTDYLQLDLSITNHNLIKELEKLPLPDLIIASPPCMAWSIADSAFCLVKSVDSESDNNFSYFKLRKFNFYNQNNLDPTKGKRDPFKRMQSFLNGLSCITGLIKIINYFKPKYYVIENPETSKIWDVIKYLDFYDNNYINKTYYSNYDLNFSLKPTIFLSNYELNLERDYQKRTKYKSVLDLNRQKRSDIPLELIREIVSQSEVKNDSES